MVFRVISIIAFLVLGPILGCLLAGLDRKLSARMQRRVGPPVLQPYYDVRKLFEKEKLAPTRFQDFYILVYLVFLIGSGVIFFGGGRIARKAATELTNEMNIKIIEKDRELCNMLSEKVPNALIINADGSDMDILKEEGIQDTDAFVAVTDSSEANIFACLAAKRFGVRKTIAEVENLDYIPMAEGLDIGAVLNKKTIAASYIYQMLLDASVRGVHNLTSADAEIVEFYAKEGSTITRHKVKDLLLPKEANIGGIVRAGEGILVNGETQIIAGDLVVVFCKSHVIRNLERFFK